ncbi:hypothetical protein MMC07_008845 [Pseudocyphellaria aurata]|nr:hypothetical protein [Pseudocyphellaria aurata]
MSTTKKIDLPNRPIGIFGSLTCLTKATFIDQTAAASHTMPQNDADFDQRTFNA